MIISTRVSGEYLGFTITFPLFYLFNWKFVDLMVFSFLQGKICATVKRGAPKRFCVPECPKSKLVAQFTQAGLNKNKIVSLA